MAIDELRRIVADRIRQDGASKVARLLCVGREPVMAFALGACIEATDLQIKLNAHRLNGEAETR